MSYGINIPSPKYVKVDMTGNHIHIEDAKVGTAPAGYNTKSTTVTLSIAGGILGAPSNDKRFWNVEFKGGAFQFFNIAEDIKRLLRESGFDKIYGEKLSWIIYEAVDLDLVWRGETYGYRADTALYDWLTLYLEKYKKDYPDGNALGGATEYLVFDPRTQELSKPYHVSYTVDTNVSVNIREGGNGSGKR